MPPTSFVGAFFAAAQVAMRIREVEFREFEPRHVGYLPGYRLRHYRRHHTHQALRAR